jgi:hypothetical protein
VSAALDARFREHDGEVGGCRTHCPHNRLRCNCQLLRSRYNLKEYLVAYLDRACLRGDMKVLPEIVLRDERR